MVESSTSEYRENFRSRSVYRVDRPSKGRVQQNLASALFTNDTGCFLNPRSRSQRDFRSVILSDEWFSGASPIRPTEGKPRLCLSGERKKGYMSLLNSQGNARTINAPIEAPLETPAPLVKTLAPLIKTPAPLETVDAAHFDSADVVSESEHYIYTHTCYLYRYCYSGRCSTSFRKYSCWRRSHSFNVWRWNCKSSWSF